VTDSRRGWYAVAILTLANVSGWIDRQILNLLAPAIRADLGLSLTEMSYLIGLPFAIFFTVMGIPIARMADSGNRRNIIAAGIALWSIMTALCGLAGNYSRLLLARIGVGVGEAALQAPGTSLIADYFPRESRGTAMGVYSMGSFIGSGLAYAVGGWVIGLVTTQVARSWSVLGIGVERAWQAVFLAVGLPGLLIAVLMLSIREPSRHEQHRTAVPIRTFIAYIRANLRTFLCLTFGYALSLSVNLGIAAWLATFLIEAHGWSAARAGIVMGVLTMTVGTAGVVLGGRLADWFVAKGRTDGPLRVGIIASIGMLVSATMYPFASSAFTAVTWLVFVNFFAAFPWGAATAAAAEIVPPSMRAQGVALYAFVLSLIASAFGPISVAAVTDYVFRDESMLKVSLAIVNVVGMTGAIALFALGLPAYRRTLAEQDSAPSGPLRSADNT
jgi:MFS family permease